MHDKKACLKQLDVIFVHAASWFYLPHDVMQQCTALPHIIFTARSWLLLERWTHHTAAEAVEGPMARGQAAEAQAVTPVVVQVPATPAENCCSRNACQSQLCAGHTFMQIP